MTARNYTVSGDFGASVYVQCDQCHDDIATNPGTVDAILAAVAAHHCTIDTTATDLDDGTRAGDGVPACTAMDPGPWPFLCTKPQHHTGHHAAHADDHDTPVATWANTNG